MEASALQARIASVVDRHLTAFAMEQGFDRAGSIPDAMTFREWCQLLGDQGLKVDGKPFTLHDRPAMQFVYDLVPTTMQEAYGQTIVLQKCAQVGFTVMEMLASLYMSIKFEPITTGMFLPGRDLAALKSSKRFLPIVRLVPAAYDRLIEDEAAGGARRRTEGNVMARQLGGSLTLFLWTSGKTTTESMPMDVLTFDEVQEMLVSDMEKTVERLSASPMKFTLMGSTANWPDADINHWYKKGTQHRFHTLCPACGVSSVLDDYFPEKDGRRCCIQWHAGTRDWRYECPQCHAPLADTQLGEWVPDQPGAIDEAGRGIKSLHFPQTLSPTISAREFMESYNSATDMKNFYNRKLGKPFNDPSQVPITLEHLQAAADKGMAHGLTWKRSARGTYAGIDNMGGYSCMIILERLPNGVMALVHAEQVHGLDPWERLSEIMRQYGVVVCVCEQLPNYDSAKQFAQRHLGKVFLVSRYCDIPDDMLRWGDARQTRQDYKTADDARDEHTVELDQYKMMDWSFARITGGTLWTPDPNGLSQSIMVKKLARTVLLLREVLWNHFTRTALVTEKDPDEHKMRRFVKKIGIDPHFSFALMMACAAYCRAYGTSSFIMPDVSSSEGGANELRNLPGLPASVVQALAQLPESVCGRCEHFEAGLCKERGLGVMSTDVSCMLYERRDDD